MSPGCPPCQPSPNPSCDLFWALQTHTVNRSGREIGARSQPEEKEGETRGVGVTAVPSTEMNQLVICWVTGRGSAAEGMTHKQIHRERGYQKL